LYSASDVNGKSFTATVDVHSDVDESTLNNVEIKIECERDSFDNNASEILINVTYNNVEEVLAPEIKTDTYDS
jgi:hypothetical protein